MRKYPREHWQALGKWVATARMQAGYTNTQAWSAAANRSSRMLLGLERGEPVGAGTIEAIAEALGVTNWALFGILSSGDESFSLAPQTPDEIQAARDTYERETGLEADSDMSGDLLDFYSDADLLAELGRRLATRPRSRTERRLREVQADVSDRASTTETAVAAHDEEVSTAGEQGESETP